MELYAFALGNDDAACPAITTGDWFACIYMPASAGPIELPMILIRLFVPSDIPVCCIGVASIVTFIAPTFVKDSPVDSTARPREIVIRSE